MFQNNFVEPREAIGFWKNYIKMIFITLQIHSKGGLKIYTFWLLHLNGAKIFWRLSLKM